MLNGESKYIAQLLKEILLRMRERGREKERETE
jgi:hypothetical protein